MNQDWPPRVGDLWQDKYGGRWFARGPRSGHEGVRLYPPMDYHAEQRPEGQRPEGWKLLARFGDERRQIGMGHATWEWDQEMGLHLPVCSRWKYDVRRGGVYRCGNGPLSESEIASGTCSEGPHLNLHECEGRSDAVRQRR